MNSSRTLADRFRTQQTDRIRVDGIEVVSMTEIPLDHNSVLEVLVEDSRPDIEQSLRIRSTSGDIEVIGTSFQPSESVLVLAETYPAFEIGFSNLQVGTGTLQLWNSWILGDGEHAWIGNSGIVVEPLPIPEGATNRMRLWCSDGLGDPDFDDLVLLLTVGPKGS